MDLLTSEIHTAALVGHRHRVPRRVVFVVNTDRFFLSHRATWAVAYQAGGADVTVIAEDTGESTAVSKLGFRFIDIPIGRETTSATTMVTSAMRVFVALLRIRPGLVFLVHQVAYTVGWPAALLLRRSIFIRVAGGVGRALDPSALRTAASRVVQASGRHAGRLPNVFSLFQVENDRQTFIRLGLLPSPGRSCVIPGTGVNVADWHRDIARDFTRPVILFASRLIREKGIHEFIDAAEELRGRGWRFLVAGEPDRGVDSAVSAQQLEGWRTDAAIEFLGYRTDMANVLAAATLFVFPTRHPEGTPRVLIEAGASGLPAVVSGTPGCTAVIKDGVTGIVLSPVPSAGELAAAIEALASDPGRAATMGAAARERIRDNFSVEAVLTALLEWTKPAAPPA